MPNYGGWRGPVILVSSGGRKENPPRSEVRTDHHTFATQTMRKIEQQMNTAISKEIDWKKDNTEVVNIDGVSYVYLFGNKIAEVGDTWIRIFDGGHQSVTTKSRLNAILRVHGVGSEGVFQKNYTWFFRDAMGDTIPFFSGMRLN